MSAVKLVVAAMLLSACASTEQLTSTSTSAPVVSTVVSTTSTTTTTDATTTTVVVPAEPVVQRTTVRPSDSSEQRCSEWVDLVLDVGWPAVHVETVQRLMFRESRCDPSQFNPDDPRGGSRGLLQINGHWCRPNPSYGIHVGWLQEHDLIGQCDDLFDAEANLRSALLIWSEYGFEPWAL
jgi:hypothetical protein